VTDGPWLEEVVLVAGVLGLAGFLAWLGARLLLARLELRREREKTLRELLGRMESPERAVAFLGSEEGRALLGEAPAGAHDRAAARALVGGAAVAGPLGVALLVVARAGAGDPALAGERATWFAWGVLACGMAAAALLLAGTLRALSGRSRGDG